MHMQSNQKLDPGALRRVGARERSEARAVAMALGPVAAPHAGVGVFICNAIAEKMQVG